MNEYYIKVEEKQIRTYKIEVYSKKHALDIFDDWKEIEDCLVTEENAIDWDVL